MNLKRFLFPLFCLSVLSVLSVAQTSDLKTFNANGVSFDYPDGWVVHDDSNSDAQQLTLARANNDVQIRVFVHKGRITPEKLPDAKKAFIDPYIASTVKQFVAMGAKPEQSADSSEIAGAKAEGVKIAANLGEPGAAKIYWGIVGQRTVILTIFGPDREIKQFTPAWDMVRNTLKVEDKSTPKPSPTP
ncbi:MAG TPA: hypothetical protein VFY34_05750 [Pyrinomonadaceae bacterium]|nr:hypothetical protein [Pyrinomonadaceae bacterium]